MTEDDLIGQRFGRRVVMELTRDAHGHPTCRCLCDCGGQSVVRRSELLAGKYTSCRKCAQVRHGDVRNGSAAPEWNVWRSLIQRCGNPASPSYAQYGGRGIRVCRRWLESYENFLADMGRKPSPKYSLDRIDGDGDYKPGNCRWATAEEQNNNLSSNLRIEWQGRTQTVAQWARELGLHYDTLRTRIVCGWPLERVFNPGLERSRKAQARQSPGAMI